MNNREKILNIIKKRTNKKFSDSTEISSLGLDSLDLIELVMEIENELDIKIPDEELLKIKTIKELLAIIKKNK